MGGGAGIKFDVQLDEFTFTLRTWGDRQAKTTVLQWDALGYEDGMANVSGSLLKAKVLFTLTRDEQRWLKERGATVRDHLTVSRFTASTVLWCRYVRGRWQEEFPLELKGEAEFEFLGLKRVTVVIAPSDQEEFRYFWEDVFEWTPDPEEKDDAGRLVPTDLQCEWHDNDNRANYQVRAG